MGTERKRIVIADRHERVRRELVARLSREPDIQVVGVAENSAQTLACVLEKQPDILIIDPVMGDDEDWEVLRQIRHRLPEMAIVVLTSVADMATQVELKRLGVWQVLSKDLDLQPMLQALRGTL